MSFRSQELFGIEVQAYSDHRSERQLQYYSRARHWRRESRPSPSSFVQRRSLDCVLTCVACFTCCMEEWNGAWPGDRSGQSVECQHSYGV